MAMGDGIRWASSSSPQWGLLSPLDMEEPEKWGPSQGGLSLVITPTGLKHKAIKGNCSTPERPEYHTENF